MSSFQKRHYDAIAAAVREAREINKAFGPRISASHLAGVTLLQGRLTKMLYDDNPGGFDPDRFELATRPDPEHVEI